jgi:hypothetical protein
MADKFIVNSPHAVDLASGQVVAPGEKLPANAVNEKDPHDKRLLDEAVLQPLGGKSEAEKTETKKGDDSK